MKYLFIAFLTAIISCSDSKPILIHPFTVLNGIDSITNGNKKTYFKTEYFLIEHYKDSPRYNSFIDSYLKAHRAKDWNKYSSYLMIVYKQSEFTNLKGNGVSMEADKFKKYTDDNDMIMVYTWYQDNRLTIDKLKNGESRSPKDTSIKIFDLPKDSLGKNKR